MRAFHIKWRAIRHNKKENDDLPNRELEEEEAALIHYLKAKFASSSVKMVNDRQAYFRLNKFTQLDSAFFFQKSSSICNIINTCNDDFVIFIFYVYANILVVMFRWCVCDFCAGLNFAEPSSQKFKKKIHGNHDWKIIDFNAVEFC